MSSMGEARLETLQECQLQADNSTDTDTGPNLTETEIIKSTCIVYISIFVALFTLFLILRPRYPRAYNIKKSFPSLNTPVAEDAFGFINWTWRVFNIDYEDISEQCGMDAVSTIRLLEMGVKLSLVGIFNSTFLVPVYAFAGTLALDGEADPVKGTSLSNLEQGHPGAVATTVAAYIFFAAAMRLVDKDFEWFTYHRHKFLSKKRIQNYSLFLSGLPEEMQSSKVLKEYFVKCFSEEAVAEIDLALIIPNLEKKVAKRDKLRTTLEHAINIQTYKDKTPTHKTKICGGERVESIAAYSQEIDELNEEILADIDGIKTMQKKREAGLLRSDDVEDGESAREPMETSIESTVPTSPGDEGAAERGADWLNLSKYKSTVELGATTLATTAQFGATRLATTAQLGATTLKSILIGDEGAPRDAAFVCFSDLTSANLARQIVHNQEPWCCVPKEPPMPDCVNWKNVGKSNFSKQIGELISLVLTTVLCIFWTIPVGFVASLSNVEALTELLPFLKVPVENYHWFSNLLAVLAPLLLVAFISLLPYIILFIVKFEGSIELETLQHPSLFAKLSAFTIIQTFFISTIASTLWSSIQGILKEPACAITIVAGEIPSKAGFFIQVIIVQNLLPLGIELLRIKPIVKNIIRTFLLNKLGHNLTEKERNQKFLGLRSLDDPEEYYFGTELGQKTVLVFMVLYVYGCMAPITSYFTLLVFGLLTIGLRHQFIYIYPIANDSGGKLWLNFIKLSVACMIVAEICLWGILLLKECFVAAALLVPLIIGTILFDIYFKRRHYSITSYLPLGDCEGVDNENQNRDMANDWLKGAYLQPALQEQDSSACEGEQQDTLDGLATDQAPESEEGMTM